MFLMLPMCSPRVFSIIPCFNPICFAQSPPLFMYIVGPKGDALHLSIESSIFWEFFFLTMGQKNWLIAKKNNLIGLVGHPQLINMKHNKYSN